MDYLQETEDLWKKIVKIVTKFFVIDEIKSIAECRKVNIGKTRNVQKFTRYLFNQKVPVTCDKIRTTIKYKINHGNGTKRYD